jgi:uncharacterized protein (TIGR04255 family)
MTDQPHFEPMFPSHAIERCVATVMFAESLPAKAFQRAVELARNVARNVGLEALPASAAMIGFQFDALSGRTTPVTGPGPNIFMTADRAMQLIVAPNSLALRTGRYVRWQPFAGEIDELMLPLLDSFVDVLSIANIQLEYLDRFLWTGKWSTFHWPELLRADGQFVAGKASSASVQWHSHSGWFEEQPGFRRLINVNIDVGDVVPVPTDSQPEGSAVTPPAIPSVGILTLMRDDQSSWPPEGGPAKYDGSPSVQAGLEQLHNGLKSLLGQIITPQMAARIGLRTE